MARLPAGVATWLVVWACGLTIGARAEEPAPLWPRVWRWPSGTTLRLRGRVDTDALWARQSAANEAYYGPLNDVVGLRRARVGVEGDLGSEGRYIAEIDLASGEVVPRDVFVGWGETREEGERQGGHFREPFSLEGGTSARYFAFMERSPINMLDPARSWGAGLFREAPERNAALGLGVFHAGTGPSGLEAGPGAMVGFTGRLTTAPINVGDGRRLLHFGLALSERIPEDGVVVINLQPRSPLLEFGDSSTSPFVPVIDVPATFQQLVNVQFASVDGPLWMQAEWYGSFIDQKGGGDVFLRGCHVDCGWFLTGEHRRYETDSGTFGPIRVRRPWLRGAATRDRPHGYGGWELTARFTYLDFDDADLPPDDQGAPTSILLPQSTWGVNWYLSDRVRLMVNYSFAVPDAAGDGATTASLFGTRLAVYW